MLPEAIKTLAMTKRGVIIFVVATGTGKSTSLASMIGYRNEKSKGHIITIEDPIEYIHEHRGRMVTRREVGVDTPSFEVALKNTASGTGRDNDRRDQKSRNDGLCGDVCRNRTSMSRDVTCK